MNLDTTTYRKDLKYPVKAGAKPRGYGFTDAKGLWVNRRRSLQDIKTLLLHTTNSPLGNTDYRNEATFLLDSWDVSSGYVVSTYNEMVVQLLDDTLPAWHSGNCADNDFENATSIGIEIAWVPNRGLIPAIGIANVTALTQLLLQRIPSITKIDTHRKQAIPAGRKIDPSGWSDGEFYAWADDMLKRRVDYTALWGEIATPTETSWSWDIPRLWKQEYKRLGRCLSVALYDNANGVIVQAFEGGDIRKANGETTVLFR